MSNISHAAYTDKPSLLSLLPDLRKVSSSNGGEFAGPCPFCSGTDRFRAWPDTDRYWCRKCDRRGDSIQLLRDLHGLNFKEACQRLGLSHRLRAVPRRGDRSTLAREAERKAFAAWQDAIAVWLHAERRQLEEAKPEVELMYRLTRRFSYLFDRDEHSYWTRRLAAIYDRLTEIQTQLDILTDPQEIHERYAWWRSGKEGA